MVVAPPVAGTVGCVVTADTFSAMLVCFRASAERNLDSAAESRSARAYMDTGGAWGVLETNAFLCAVIRLEPNDGEHGHAVSQGHVDAR